jgi:O-antigen ligase
MVLILPGSSILLWIALGILFTPLLIMTAATYPGIFPVILLFAGEFKGFAFLSAFQELLDITAASVALLSLVVVIKLLALATNRARPAGKYFGGQWKEIGSFFLFAALVTLSYAYTTDQNYGWIKLSRFLCVGGLLFLSPFILIRSEKDFRHFALATIYGATAVSARTIISLVWNAAEASGDISRIGRSWILGIAILLVLYVRLYERRGVSLLVKGASLLCLVAGMVACAARGPIVSILFVLALSLFIHLKKKGVIPRLVTSAATMILFIGIAVVSFHWLIPFAHMKLTSKLGELEELMRGSVAPESSSEIRMRLSKMAVAAFSDRPIFGLGIGGFRRYYYGESEISYPHNLLLEILAEEGLIGLSAFLLFLMLVVKGINRAARATSNRFIVLLWVLVFLLSTSLISGNLDDGRVLFMWCGVSLAVSRFVGTASADLSGVTSPESGLTRHCLRG